MNRRSVLKLILLNAPWIFGNIRKQTQTDFKLAGVQETETLSDEPIQMASITPHTHDISILGSKPAPWALRAWCDSCGWELRYGDIQAKDMVPNPTEQLSPLDNDKDSNTTAGRKIAIKHSKNCEKGGDVYIAPDAIRKSEGSDQKEIDGKERVSYPRDSYAPSHDHSIKL